MNNPFAAMNRLRSGPPRAWRARGRVLFATVLGPRAVARAVWVWVVLATCTCALVVPAPATAAKPDNPTAFEISQLPPYCVDTEWFAGPKNSPRQSPKALQWEKMMGYGFWSLHHYCWGLVSLSRFHTSPLVGEARMFLVHQIISEYYYVLNNTPPDFILRPEVLLRLGEAELLRENYGGAYDAFIKARQLKPDYWPAYSKWAEVLIKAKKTADARKLIEEGLKYAPDAKVLLEMYRKLGGDLATIQSIAAKAEPAAAAASATSAAPISASALADTAPAASAPSQRP